MARRSLLPRGRRPLLGGLPQRAYLTVKHHGWGSLLFRLVTSPLRLIGFERRLAERLKMQTDRRRARAWYAEHGRPVTIVVPTYGPPDMTIEAVGRLRKTLKRVRASIVVVDDGSPPAYRERLKDLQGADVVLAPENAGFAAAVNRGIERAGPGDDVVVLNNDVVAHGPWLEFLQRAAYYDGGAGIVGPKLIYPDGRIQSAGSYRNLDAPEWFDHRYRFKPERFGPAQVPANALAVTGACMYIRGDVLTKLGLFDESLPMAYEDVDYCLRAWEAGYPVGYEPRAALTHVESPTRGTELGDRERESQARFWATLGGVVRRAVDDHAGWRPAGGLRDRGHRRRRRPPRHVRAPEPAAGPRALGGALLARRAARVVRPRRAGADLRGLRASSPTRWRRWTRSRSRPGGGPRRRYGAARCGAAGPSTSSRTSRRPTTPTTTPATSTSAARSWPATARSSGT